MGRGGGGDGGGDGDVGGQVASTDGSGGAGENWGASWVLLTLGAPPATVEPCFFSVPFMETALRL